MEYCISLCDASVVVVDQDRAILLKTYILKTMPSVCWLIVGADANWVKKFTGDGAARIFAFDDFIDLSKSHDCEQLPEVEILPDDDATSLVELLEHPELAKYDISSLKLLGSGGAPLSSEKTRKFGKKISAQSNGYGLTETTSMSTSNGSSLIRMKPTSVGLSSPVVSVMIAQRLNGHEGLDASKMKIVSVKKPGTVGEICIRGPNVFKEYWRNPAATRAAITSTGWFLTGDIGFLDAEGCLYILDRAKDIIIRGGENIYCLDVEEAICLQSSIQECAVIGIPDKKYGESVCALVIMKEGHNFNAKAILNNCTAHLAKFKRPTLILEWKEKDFPRNAAGKIVKTELKKKFSRGLPSKL
ncbi:hypothetical protein HK100_009061 [Physocladia obscura]|uniref:Uncharacterized protein n=1 Tax=Physocladia obscura TaxID=109957 RepID=A0AAD5T3Q7_9FUNG|nr:hypothetical protein HK100_009061 [Physocladia obscura]